MRYLTGLDSGFWHSLFSSPWVIMINLMDIILVAWLIYRFIKTLAGTKIMSLVQGAVLFVIMRFAAEFLGFTTITYLMNQVITYGVIAAVVIFAPEIRTGLEKFGRSTQVFRVSTEYSNEEHSVDALVKAVTYMSPRKIGALIAIEQAQTLQEYCATGISLDADISSQLLINIFIPNTPLHDGAVIIRANKVATASSYLPLSESQVISKEFGTRHRAAIGLSEQSDALIVIVSEETGAISVAHRGSLRHDLALEELRQLLAAQLVTPKETKQGWFKWRGGRPRD